MDTVLNALSSIVTSTFGAGGQDDDTEPKPSTQIYSTVFKQEGRLSEVQKTIDDLRSTNARLKQQQRDIERRKAHTQQQLLAVRQDLEAIQVLSPNEGVMMSQGAIPHFLELENEIDRLAVEIVSQLDRPPTPQTIGQLLRNRRREQNEVLSVFLRFASDYYAEFASRHLLLVVTQFLLRVGIWKRIFQPSIHNMVESQAEGIRRVYAPVHARLTQERSARWRALTYSYVDRSTPKVDASQVILGDFSRFLDSISCATLSAADMFDLYGKQMKLIVDHARNFQDRVQTQCTDASIVVELDASHHSYIRLINGTGKGTKAILPIGFGLVAVRAVEKENGAVQRMKRTLSLSPYIGNDWLPPD